jgi:hypothetical protein
MSDLYQYKPLLHDRSLRILVLHPARITDAPLMIDLQETPLDKAHHKFDALSYVWGLRSNDIDSAAFCCGKTIPIGPNCDAALRRLRSTRRIRRLFVDAICMDQSNDEEKEGQIKLMGEFYISARRVLIWLGKGSEQTDRAFKHFRRLYRFRHLVNDKKISETLRKRVWDVIGSGYGMIILSYRVIKQIKKCFKNKPICQLKN